MYPKENLRNKVCEHKITIFSVSLHFSFIYHLFLLSKTLKFIEEKKFKCDKTKNSLNDFVKLIFLSRTNEQKNWGQKQESVQGREIKSKCLRCFMKYFLRMWKFNEILRNSFSSSRLISPPWKIFLKHLDKHFNLTHATSIVKFSLKL